MNFHKIFMTIRKILLSHFQFCLFILIAEKDRAASGCGNINWCMISFQLNNDPYWICGAQIFSGRYDPSWLVNEDEAKKILTIWNSLPDYRGNVSIPNISGYKGCYLSSSSKERWTSFRGIVTLSRENKIIESRTDTERKIEKALLKTAPEDAIPKAMLLEEFR